MDKKNKITNKIINKYNSIIFIFVICFYNLNIIAANKTDQDYSIISESPIEENLDALKEELILNYMQPSKKITNIINLEVLKTYFKEKQYSQNETNSIVKLLLHIIEENNEYYKNITLFDCEILLNTIIEYKSTIKDHSEEYIAKLKSKLNNIFNFVNTPKYLNNEEYLLSFFNIYPLLYKMEIFDELKSMMENKLIEILEEEIKNFSSRIYEYKAADYKFFFKALFSSQYQNLHDKITYNEIFKYISYLYFHYNTLEGNINKALKSKFMDIKINPETISIHLIPDMLRLYEYDHNKFISFLIYATNNKLLENFNNIKKKLLNSLEHKKQLPNWAPFIEFCQCLEFKEAENKFTLIAETDYKNNPFITAFRKYKNNEKAYIISQNYNNNLKKLQEMKKKYIETLNEIEKDYQNQKKFYYLQQKNKNKNKNPFIFQYELLQLDENTSEMSCMNTEVINITELNREETIDELKEDISNIVNKLNQNTTNLNKIIKNTTDQEHPINTDTVNSITNYSNQIDYLYQEIIKIYQEIIKKTKEYNEKRLKNAHQRISNFIQSQPADSVHEELKTTYNIFQEKKYDFIFHKLNNSIKNNPKSITKIDLENLIIIILNKEYDEFNVKEETKNILLKITTKIYPNVFDSALWPLEIFKEIIITAIDNNSKEEIKEIFYKINEYHRNNILEEAIISYINNEKNNNYENLLKYFEKCKTIYNHIYDLEQENKKNDSPDDFDKLNKEAEVINLLKIYHNLLVKNFDMKNIPQLREA